jgi:hypothetical protein
VTVRDAVPNYDKETLLRDFNDKGGKEAYLYPACGGHSLQKETNDK